MKNVIQLPYVNNTVLHPHPRPDINRSIIPILLLTYFPINFNN